MSKFEKLDNDTFLEIIKYVGGKDIDILCNTNKAFREKCRIHKKYICKNVLNIYGLKDIGKEDACELYKFMKKSDPSFENIYFLYAHAILQDKSSYIDIFNKNTDISYEEAENIGEWITDIIDEYLPININRNWIYKIGSDNIDFKPYIFQYKTVISAIKNNKQNDVFDMLNYMSEELSIGSEFPLYLEAARKSGNKELYNKLKLYETDLDRSEYDSDFDVDGSDEED